MITLNFQDTSRASPQSPRQFRRGSDRRINSAESCIRFQIENPVPSSDCIDFRSARASLMVDSTSDKVSRRLPFLHVEGVHAYGIPLSLFEWPFWFLLH